MSRTPFLSVQRLKRQLATGNVEELDFRIGVNLLVGPPNAGKTKWLQGLDFLLGDDENPFDGPDESGLSEKYDSISADVMIGECVFSIQRRWRERGAKTKIFVNDEPMSTKEFQHWIMGELGIPLLSFPKGNPMSGQTWPELSFRMLLRHIYRQQRFWADIADKQPEGEQHACILQFLGLAESIFTEEYGRLIKLKIESEKLRSRRDQYSLTLDDLAREIIAEPGLTVSLNVVTIKAAEDRIGREIEKLREDRIALLTGARDRAVPPEHRGRVEWLGQERADTLVALESLRGNFKELNERLADLRRYRTELGDEIERLGRADDAGRVLSDLRVTNCPACDQSVISLVHHHGECFLCHQHLDDEVLVDGLGSVRLRFEIDRLNAEVSEANDLIALLERDLQGVSKQSRDAEERLKTIENEIAPARAAVGALVQEEVSALDRALGESNERQRQLRRIASAMAVGEELTERIEAIERDIRPLQANVDEAFRATDFDGGASDLESGINAYFGAINALKPGSWRHSAVSIDSTAYETRIRVGKKRWSSVLGGTDTLYFLMAYHYGLLSLSGRAGRHYPGISIIDVPGEFLGEEVMDKENFIVQPFIDLLEREEYEGAQVIITGASFTGLMNVNRLELRHVYAA